MTATDAASAAGHICVIDFFVWTERTNQIRSTARVRSSFHHSGKRQQCFHAIVNCTHP